MTNQQPILLRLGRRYCPTCNRTRAVVWHEGAEDLRCPRCEGVTEPASGCDAEREEGT